MTRVEHADPVGCHTQTMNTLDLIAIIGYFVLVTGVGFWFRKRASKDIESYFLGGRKLPWFALAMSGSVSNFDITGTMWMVSVMYVLGMQSWWHHWMWGVALPAFGTAYMARWVRRSSVITAAEWMKTRFGPGAAGKMARYAAGTLAIMGMVGMIGYAFEGIGKFSAVYIPLEALDGKFGTPLGWIPEHEASILATAIFAITTLYVVLGGLFSVVVTDVIQTVILTLGGLIIAGIAYVKVSPELIQQTVDPGFATLTPRWRIEEFAGTDNAMFEMFGLLTIAWVFQGLCMNLGGPAQHYDFQRHLAASSERDACKLAAAWPFFLIIRWAMVAGITMLGITGVVAADDPETIMPIVLQEYLPAGVRGVVIAGLLAAFMSTFSSTVNAGASFVVRDFWQPLVRPHASQKELIRSSYVATVVIVVGGVVMGLRAQSISEIWVWLSMALGAGAIVPNALRWYWWRLNGWGYAGGIIGGLLVMYTLKVGVGLAWFDELPLYQSFPAIVGGSLIGCVCVSLATPRTDDETLDRFVKVVHPFGIWGVVNRRVGDAAKPDAGETGGFALANVFLGISAITGLYLGPMYLIGHWHTYAAICFGGAAACLCVMYFTWYKQLPPADKPDEFSDSV